jgi:hypothetical protein
MNGRQLRDSLEALGAAIDCREVAVRVECLNLETVYVVADEHGLWISDRGETFAYVDCSEDHHRPSRSAIEELCVEFGVVLDDLDPELYARIKAFIADDEDPQSAIDRVASAIEAIFRLSQRRH